MRKYLFAFLAFMMAIPAMADNWIKFESAAVEDAINTLVAQENRQTTADEFQKQMDQTTGKISVMGIYKVCAVAGKDINTSKGYSDCRYFINQMAEKSGFGTKSATQGNCASQMNGVWTLSADGKQYQCVGKDGFKLVYKKSCDNTGGECIKDFHGLKTQGPVGREFIAEYAKKKNLNLTCHIGFETRRSVTSPLGQDYIRCSAGGKAYEFEFDSLNETPGKTSIESENKTMCEFFGGKIVKHSDSSVEKMWQSCDIARDVCDGKIHDFATRIGHTNNYQGYCRLSREVENTSTVFLKQIPGVDSYVFYKSGAQMRADMAKVQLEEYLHNTFPTESYINCDSTVKKFDKGTGARLDPDFYMTCTVGSKQVDFVFADLTEGNKSRADTGMDAMQCITSGGTFNGETCRGPTQDECTKLDAALRAKGSTEGAKWDEDVRACILGNAMKTYRQDVATNYIVGAVVIVGGAIVTIGTGGAAVPVIISGAEMLVTDLAMNYTIDWNHRRLSKQAASRYSDFILDAFKCKDEPCALKVLQKHYATLSGVMNDLNKDDQAIVDYEMDKLIGLIQTEYVACGKNEKGQIVFAAPADCAKQRSKLHVIDYIDKVSEPVLNIGSIMYNPGYVTARFSKIKKFSKIMTIDEVMDVAHMSATDRKFFEAYKKYGKRSQTPEEFKAMFDGDYAKLEDAIKTGKWVAWDKISASDIERLKELETQRDLFILKNREAWHMHYEGRSYAEIAEAYPEIKPVQQEIEALESRGVTKEFVTDGNYSTHNQQLEDLRRQVREDTGYLAEKKAREDVLDNNPVWKEIDDIVESEYRSKKISYDNKDARWEELAKARGTSKKAFDEAVSAPINLKIKEYNTTIIPQATKLDNKDFVVAERVQLYSEIVDKDPELRSIARRFDKLTDEEKIAFGQKIMDKSGDYTSSGGYQLKSTSQWDTEHTGKASDFAGSTNSGKKTIYINLKYEGKSLPGFMNILAHEDGHKVDTMMPEMGMLGAQKGALSSAAYTTEPKFGYRKTLDEQSSNAIGDAVEKAFTYRYQTVSSYGKSDANYIDNLSAAVATIGAGGNAIEEIADSE